jgi:hypothetical protein
VWKETNTMVFPVCPILSITSIDPPSVCREAKQQQQANQTDDNQDAHKMILPYAPQAPGERAELLRPILAM